MLYDVIIVGGGTTGACAAIAAAKAGVKVAVIECEGFLGGNAANGLPWLGFHHAKTGRQVVAGLPAEIVRRLRAGNGATKTEADPICGSVTGVNSTMLKLVLSELFTEYHIHTYLHTFANSAVQNQEGIWEIGICNTQGSGRLYTKYLIDCTDAGTMAIFASASYHFGRESDQQPQVASTVVRFGGIDISALIGYFQENPGQMRPFHIEKPRLEQYLGTLPNAEIFVIGAFPELVLKAKEDGLDYPRDRVIGVVNAKEKEMILVSSRVTKVDPRNNECYSKAEHIGLQQTRTILQLLREYLPGCRNAFPIASGHTIGLRETYHIEGDILLCADDLLSGRRFDDAVAMGGYHLDIHSPDTQGLVTHFPPCYEIPYRCMLPKGIDNLLVAGRCISATQEAQASIRVIPILGALGEAAGEAAALAQKSGRDLREIDVKQLQTRLKQNGALLP